MQIGIGTISVVLLVVETILLVTGIYFLKISKDADLRMIAIYKEELKRKKMYSGEVNLANSLICEVCKKSMSETGYLTIKNGKFYCDVCKKIMDKTEIAERDIKRLNSEAKV